MKRILIFSLLLISNSLIYAQTTFYVSTNGKDGNDGSKKKPFATLTNARDAIRKLGDKKQKGVTVVINGGDYRFTEPFELLKEDGGSLKNPVIYTAAKNQIVNFVGSFSVANNQLKAINDKETLARIIPSLQGKILALDLTAYQLNHIKAYPNIFNDDGGILGLFVNGARMPLSRYPNTSYMAMKKVIINGGGQETKNDDWANYYAAGAKEKVAPRPGVFEYRNNRAASWVSQLDRGVWLKGYWRIPWQNECVRIGNIDTIAKTITLKEPVPGGIGNKYTRPEGNGMEQYWLLNLLEEIDMAGEWAVDFKDKKLYFYPPENYKGEPLEIADSKGAVIEMNTVSNLTFKNINIEQSVNEGIILNECSNVLIAGCTIKNVNKYAVKISNGKNNTVQSCDLNNLGEGGVWLSGGDESVAPRIAAGHKVVNNHIYNFGQIVHIYVPAVNAGFTGGGGGGHHTCVGNYVAHNLIHDTPHGGVIYGSWDNVFEYNEIFRFCTVSNDLGAFYSYDLHTRSGNNTFAYNFIHNSNDGDGIYFDHDHYDMHVYGNILALNSRGGKRGTGYLFKRGSMATTSYPIDCYNNIAVDCGYGFQLVTSESPLNNWQNNVAINCKVPFEFKYVLPTGKEAKQDPSVANGPNMAYMSNPGFVNMEQMNFKLLPNSQLLKDLPNFKPIPVEKIGLYKDEYRKRLPTNQEIDRYSNGDGKMSLNQPVLDRN